VHIREKKRVSFQTAIDVKESLELGGLGNATIIKKLNDQRVDTMQVSP